MFLHLCAILFTGGGGLPTPWMQTPPLDADTPWMQTPPLDADTPWMQTPLPLDADPLHPDANPLYPNADPLPSCLQTPVVDADPHSLDADPPLWIQTPPLIRSASGRYASYWNAYLFYKHIDVEFRHWTVSPWPPDLNLRSHIFAFSWHWTVHIS